MTKLLPIKFTEAEANKASDEWRFNCGPGAICAVLNMTPDELRPKLGDFEKKGYVNPTMMLETLARCGATCVRTYRADKPGISMPKMENGVVRVQFSGPWTKPGVPMAARYRQTHWVGVRGDKVFDVNAVSTGGWLDCRVWESKLIPWLLEAACPKSDGGWWPTHAYAVTPP